MAFKLEEYHRDTPDDELLADLVRVANSLGKKSVTADEYRREGKFHPSTLQRRFRTWFGALERAGLEHTRTLHVTDEDWFENLEQVWETLGRQPRYSEMTRPFSKYSAEGYAHRFGSWRRALEAFVAFAETEDRPSMSSAELVRPQRAPTSQRTSRNASWRVRFLVLRRDNFACRSCGASPAKDPRVTLHLDHLIPWSQGGETTEGNLQTLCEACNIGRSNLPFSQHP